jgi:Holliday junction resolvasome RuvABC endonuclease subunit
MSVMGLDPGFASLGWATVDPRTMKLLDADVFRTKSGKTTAKKVLASDDNFRRAKEIAAWFDDERFKDVEIVCAESMSFPRNSSAAAKVALCWGVIAAICYVRGIPLVQNSPQKIKKSLCGVSNATDEALNAALEVAYPGATALIEKNIKAKSQRQHAFDGLGAIHAARESELFVLLRGRR